MKRLPMGSPKVANEDMPGLSVVITDETLAELTAEEGAEIGEAFCTILRVTAKARLRRRQKKEERSETDHR